jgi:hypothetical protein
MSSLVSCGEVYIEERRGQDMSVGTCELHGTSMEESVLLLVTTASASPTRGVGTNERAGEAGEQNYDGPDHEWDRC